MLMSDVTYLLDESLTRLTEIRALENELDNPGAEASRNPVSIITNELSHLLVIELTTFVIDLATNERAASYASIKRTASTVLCLYGQRDCPYAAVPYKRNCRTVHG
jgi:hypothetical protein